MHLRTSLRVSFLLLLLFINKNFWVHSLDVVRIGGLFDSTDDKQQIAFRYAVDSINSDRNLLPHVRLSAQGETVPPNDSFRGSRKVCSLLRGGVAAIFGPHSPHTSAHVQSICDALEVPHIENRWDFRLQRGVYSVNLYPHPGSLAKSYIDVLKGLGWTRFCIIYETNNGLVRVQELLKIEDFKISLRQLPNSHDYRPLLKEAKKAGVTHIVLDVEHNNIYKVLKQAQQVGLMTSYYNYFITSLDLHTIDLEDFRHGGTNITALRLVDPENPIVKRVLSDWGFNPQHSGGVIDIEAPASTAPSFINAFAEVSSISSVLTSNRSSGAFNIPSAFAGLASASKAAIKKYMASKLTTEVALMYDAVHMFAKALDDLDASRSIDITPLECDGDATWSHGNSIINYMKWVQISGLTGVIRFDTEGFRRDISLDIIELAKEGLVKVGQWELGTGANYTRTFIDVQKGIVESLQNKTLVVSTILAFPYTMLRETSKRMTGNDRYEGFCIDLINEISRILKFNYTIKVSPDGNHGKIYDREKNKWDGMVGELLEQRADLAIGDLTITYDREQAVDFTMPWMNLGISILYRKPTRKPPNLFSFLSPLSLEVWLYMATAYLAISVLLFVLARFSPYEWTGNSNSKDKGEDKSAGDDFSLLNCLWFCIGSLMQQGGDLLPKAVSTRIVAGIWWFFTLIMISSYTANLAAFLTVERMESPIESANDLSEQSKIKYGCMNGGSTWTFFKSSKIPTYQRMFNFMESQRPSVYTKSNAEGVERVMNSEGQYAFLMESSSIEYITERFCELTQVGGLLDSKSYGIALPPASPYRALVNAAVLKLQEMGRLHTLKNRWWKQRRVERDCKKDDSKSSSKELGLNNVGGVFVVLLAGMGLASVMAVCEFVWKSRKLATEAHASLWAEMGRELRCALSCGTSEEAKKNCQKNTSPTSPVQGCDQDQNGPAYLPMEPYGPSFTPSQYSFCPNKDYIT